MVDKTLPDSLEPHIQDAQNVRKKRKTRKEVGLNNGNQLENLVLGIFFFGFGLYQILTYVKKQLTFSDCSHA